LDLHYHPWNGPIKPYGYHHGISVFFFISRNRLNGTEFLKLTNSLEIDQREAMILHELSRGNIPCLSQVSISISDINLRVSSDYLSVGIPEDYVRIPMAVFTAQKIADLYNMTLPTTKLVDLIWNSTEFKIVPQPLPPGSGMCSNAYFKTENNLINSQVRSQGAPTCPFLGGDKKDVVLTNLYETHPRKVAIYGWQYPNGTVIQPLFIGHDATWADYSHGIRLVSNSATKGGFPVSVPLLLLDPSTSEFLSNEGPITNSRIPVAWQWAPKCFQINFD